MIKSSSKWSMLLIRCRRPLFLLWFTQRRILIFLLFLFVCVQINQLVSLNQFLIALDINVEDYSTFSSFFPYFSDGNNNKQQCQQEYDNFTIHSKAQEIDNEVYCRRVQIKPLDSCNHMKDSIRKSEDVCSKHEQLKMCEIIYEDLKEQILQFDCSYGRSNCRQINFGLFDRNLGEIVWNAAVSLSRIEIDLQLLAKTNSFIFLECVGLSSHLVNKHPKSKQDKFEQILILPNFQSREFKTSRAYDKLNDKSLLPNVNILFFDSTSRTKFYRAYPKTIQLLKSLERSGDYEVFDFKLFQSIAKNTYWHFINLFNGPESKESFGEPDFMFVEGKKFFESFKNMGYQSIYVWDHCFIYHQRPLESRLRTDKERFKRFTQMKMASSIDNFGIGDANCELLWASTETYTSYAPLQRCFNGKHMIHYQLDDLLKQQKLYDSLGIPFVSFSEDNYGHNSDASFVKFSDLELEPYLEELTRKMPNTITVIFSDHGNREVWDYLLKAYPEAQRDMYHPFLFIVFPKSLSSSTLFSSNEIEAMRTNQNRLITVRDLHQLFAKLWAKNESVLNDSLLIEKPKYLSCSDLYYAMPPMSRYCMCDQYGTESVGMEKSRQIVIFAQNLFNKMTEKHRSVCKKITFRLYNKRPFEIEKNRTSANFKNTATVGQKKEEGAPTISGKLIFASETQHGSHLVPVFDIFVQETGSGSGKKGVSHRAFELIQFDRSDSYSKYESCTPVGVDPKVCIC